MNSNEALTASSSADDCSYIQTLGVEHVAEMAALTQLAYKESAATIGGAWDAAQIGQELSVAWAVGLRVPSFGLAAFVLFRQIDAVLELIMVATHPQRQRRGDMTFLLSYLIERQRPSTTIWLEVHEKNIPAQKLYEKLGFGRVGERSKYYRDGGTAWLYSHG